MKRLLMGLVVALAVSVASAQSPGYGVYTGSPVLLGGQYQSGNFRLSAGLGILGTIGASADLILGESPLSPDLTWYYGAGANAAVMFAENFFFPLLVDAHAFLGAEYRIAEAGISIYGELQGGIGLYGGMVLSPVPGMRLGVIFR